jgi:hypothetical protein
VLNSLPAIYPFIHPELVSPTLDSIDAPLTSRPFAYRGEASSRFALPTIHQLESWRKERDGIEEEVLRFDGGDLGRMKQKTRGRSLSINRSLHNVHSAETDHNPAATLLPLTPPSTYLVSITLALILLIDKLLTLLRQRGDLLELTSLRLQWDMLRWGIVQETRKIKAEVDILVKEKQRWKPDEDARPSFARASSMDYLSLPIVGENSGSLASDFKTDLPSNGLLTPTKSHIPLLASSPSTPRASLLASPGSSSSLSLLLSPSSHLSRSTHRRSLNLPLARSQVVNLGIRHQNLASTLLVRSGAVLDKMIDIAGPLRDLGGIHGPETQSGMDREEDAMDETGDGSVASMQGNTDQGGAVPEDLLDIQDVLEAEVQNVGSSVEWVKGLESRYAE